MWLAGAVQVAPGDTLPLTATHNTVRLGFEFAGAPVKPGSTARLAPSLWRGHFAAAADGARIEAFGRAAVAAAIATGHSGGSSAGNSGGDGGSRDGCASADPAADAGSGGKRRHVSMFDAGCGTGALSLVVATAADGIAPGGAACAGRGGSVSIVGAELYEPLAAAARRALAGAANAAGTGLPAAGGNGSGGGTGRAKACVLVSDAAALERGGGGGAVPAGGFDVILGDVFGASLVGAGALGVLESVRSKLLLAPGGRLLPARGAVWCMGVQALSGGGGGGGDGAAGPDSGGGGDGTALPQGWCHQWDLSPLDRYRWGPEAEAVQLADTPHVPLTAPGKLFDFCFTEDDSSEYNRSNGQQTGHSAAAAPAGGPRAAASAAAAAAARYPARGDVMLAAGRAGLLNAVALWYDLDLGNGTLVTTGGWPSRVTDYHWPGGAPLSVTAVACVLHAYRLAS